MDIDDLLMRPESKNLDEFLDSELSKYTDNLTKVKLLELFGEYDNARNWFYSKSIALGDMRPYDLCLEGKEEQVYIELINIEHGNLC